MSVVAQPSLSALERETTRKIRWHLLPFMMTGFVLCFLDRINLSFAALQMNADLKLTPAAFGFAAGVFFLGYFLFQVPSNVMLAKVGPRRWLGPLMLVWGILSFSTAFVGGRTSLWILRFLLGVVEAGFFPGLAYYATFWFRSRDTGKTMSWLLVASYIAALIGGPLSGWLMSWGYWGFRGWQWMFFIQGIAPVIFGVIILAYWLDLPEQAKWLRPEEQAWIKAEIAAEKAAKDTPQPISVREAITRPRTLVLALTFFLHGVGSWGVIFWMPQMIKYVRQSLTPFGVGMLTTLPAIVMMCSLLFWSWRADKSGQRRWYVVIGLLVGAFGLYMFPFCHTVATAVLIICIMYCGFGAFHANFWASVIQVLGPKESAAGIGIVSSGTALGGFVGPYVAGVVKGMTTTYFAPMMVLGSVILTGAIVINAFFMHYRPQQRQQSSEARAAGPGK